MMQAKDARVLWWAMEQQLWSISDLLRLAFASGLISSGDHMVLHKLVDEIEYLVKENKEGVENAI